MKEKISNSEIKKYNNQLILRTLIRSNIVTKQKLAADTGLSIPKVTNVLTELIEMGLVEKCGIQESSGGRRPAAFCAIPDARYAAGIDVSRNHLDLQ